MDYDISFNTLKTITEDVITAKDSIKDLQNEFESSYINSLINSEIGKYCIGVRSSINRINNGINNVNNWLNDYQEELTKKETELSNFKGSSADEPIDFNGTFPNIFAKFTIPTLKSGISEEDKLITLLDGQAFSDYIPDNGSNNRVPYFSQNDSNWSGITFGPETIGSGGCGITSTAMALSYVTQEKITPSDLNDKMNINNYYCYPNVGVYHSFFSAAAEEYGINCESISGSSVTTALANGNPVIMSTGSYPFTSAGHIICLTGVTSDGKITLNDPNGSHADYSYEEWDPQYVIDRGTAFYEYSKED